MARPFINSEKPLDYSSRVVLNRNEFLFLMECAKKEGVSFSQFMRNAVADYVVKKGYRDNKPNNKTDLPTTF
jgi:hypothetical protein